MEQRFLFGLLMWGDGNLTPNYLLFCFLGSLGALQFVAGKYTRRDLTPFPSRFAQVGGVILVILAFMWFFTTQPDLFIPGLAGGEFIVYSSVAFVGAFLVSRVMAIVVMRLSQNVKSERESSASRNLDESGQRTLSSRQ
jgi:hypothetical protein